MRVHWLQHAAHEDLGCIAPWLARRGDEVRCSALHAGDALPAVADFDWLIVMGGPMNIYEHAAYPWLLPEQTLIRAAIAAGRRVLGICLGAQLVADAMGGAVTRNPEPEIGWFELQLTEAGRQSKFFCDFPQRFGAFHWHGDTFAVPPGGRLLMSSAACAHQAFELGERVVGIQYHLEVTAANARAWFAQEQPAPSKYVQASGQILADLGNFAASNRLMQRLLAAMAA